MTCSWVDQKLVWADARGRLWALRKCSACYGLAKKLGHPFGPKDLQAHSLLSDQFYRAAADLTEPI